MTVPRSSYDLPLKKLRDCFNNIAENHKLPEHNRGAIVFYRVGNTDEKDKTNKHKIAEEIENCVMRVFPLNDDAFNKAFPVYAYTLRKHIGVVKPYKNFQQLERFRKCHQNGTLSDIFNSHYYIKLKDEHVVKYVEGKTDEIMIGGKDYHLDNISFKIGAKQPSPELDALDHLLFPSGTEELLAIPVPVLCSPAVLFFIPLSIFRGVDGEFMPDAAKQFICDLTHAAADTLIFLLFHRLIEVVGREIQYSKISSEQDLFEQFCNCLANILLPISYTIKNNQAKTEKAIQKFTWFNAKESGLTQSELIKFKYTHRDGEVVYNNSLEFFLPDYVSPSKCKYGVKKISNRDEYEERIDRLGIMLNDVYLMMYRTWEPVRKREQEWASNIEPLVRKLSTYQEKLPEMKEAFKAVVEMATGINQKINEIDTHIAISNELTAELNYNITCLNEGRQPAEYAIYQVEEGRYKIIFNGQEFHGKGERENYKGAAALWKLLHYGEVKWLTTNQLQKYGRELEKNEILSDEMKTLKVILWHVYNNAREFFDHLLDMGVAVGVNLHKKGDYKIEFINETKVQSLTYDRSEAHRRHIYWKFESHTLIKKELVSKKSPAQDSEDLFDIKKFNA